MLQRPATPASSSHPRRAAPSMPSTACRSTSRRQHRGRARRLGLRQVDLAQRHRGLPAAHLRLDRARRQPVERPGADRGVVFQKDTLLPWSSVLDNVALGLKFAGVPRAERRRAGPRAAAARGPRAISPTRSPTNSPAACASGSASPGRSPPIPAILLMDEPFGALDSLTRESMQDLLVQVWAATGKQIFFITHSIEEALLLGTTVIVMSPRPGRIVARYDLDFVRRSRPARARRDPRPSPPSSALRDEIRAISSMPSGSPAMTPRRRSPTRRRRDGRGSAALVRPRALGSAGRGTVGISLATGGACLGAWQLASRYGLSSPLFLPSPGRSGRSSSRSRRTAMPMPPLAEHVAASLGRIGFGGRDRHRRSACRSASAWDSTAGPRACSTCRSTSIGRCRRSPTCRC